MQIIAINPVPSQTIDVLLSGQSCKINVYYKQPTPNGGWKNNPPVINGDTLFKPALFLDLFVLNKPILTASICLDRLNIVRNAYNGFIGGLAFVDTQGKNDPQYEGLGSRYVFIYLEVSDFA
jgi:hypothetical protein